MEFLVNIDIEMPDAVATGDVERLKTLEVAQAAELASEGTLLRLWRVPGRWANWGLWSASTVDDLHAALDSLPLRPHMRLVVHDLEAHPSDPRDATGDAPPDPDISTGRE